MARILYQDGREVGEITDWELEERFAQKKVVLGKEIETQKPKDQCHFVSPKPVHWKKALHVIEDGKTKIVLSDIQVKAGVNVTATVSSVSPNR